MSNMLDTKTSMLFQSKTKKLHITTFNHIDNCIRLTFTDSFTFIKDNIFCIIKNTKTRMEYACPITIENFSISINLDMHKEFFTDYEGVLYIIEKNKNEFISYLPIVEKINYASYFTLIHPNTTSLQWYLRILDNGEMRFSCIKK